MVLGMSMPWLALQRISNAAIEARLWRGVRGLTPAGRRDLNTTPPAAVAVTPALCAEPLKKKKRIDPGVVRAREEKRKRKLEKAIRRLEKSSRQLKPIEELQIPLAVRNDFSERTRPAPNVTGEKEDRRLDLMKQWTRHKQHQHVKDITMLKGMQDSRAKALAELKSESYQLYCEAITVDPTLIPFTHRGPPLSPPIREYDPPDGDYIDTTRQWE